MNKGLRYILLLLPLVLLSCGGSQKAVSTTGKVTVPVPVNPQVRAIFLDASKEKVLGNFADAEKLFRIVIEKEPANAAAHYELSRMLRRNNKESDAIALAQKAVALDAGNVWYKLYLAELYEDNGMPGKAISILEELVKQHPDNEEYREMLAGGYIMSGRNADAIRQLDEMEKRLGINEEIILQKRQLYLQEGKYDKAFSEMEKLAGYAPRETRYLLMLAEMHMEKGNKEAALALYRKVQDIDPGDPYINMSLADYYRKAGDNDASFRELKLGIANPRLDIDTKIQVLLSFYAVGEVYNEMRVQGIELTEILVTTHPDNPKAHSIRADFLSRDQQYAGARESLIKVVALDSSKYVIWEQLLRIELVLKEFTAMSDHARTAAEMFPSMPLLYLFRGVADYNLKNFSEAVKSFELGLKLVVADPDLKTDFHTYIGDTYQELGDFPNSVKNYQKALSLEPDNVYVLNNYAYFISLRKEDLERAAEMARRANELEPGNASYLDTYAWVLYTKGDFANAKIWMEKALQSGGSENDVILEHYGDILFRLKDNSGAMEYWRKASEKGKGSSFLQKKLSDGVLYE